MGDRVAVRFTDGKETSIAVFCHWGGKEFPNLALRFLRELYGGHDVDSMWPISRREPELVVLNFILWLKENGKIEYPEQSNYYLGAGYNDGDCSDNGCYDLDVIALKVSKVIMESYDDNKGHIIQGDENIETFLHAFDDEPIGMAYPVYKKWLLEQPVYEGA